MWFLERQKTKQKQDMAFPFLLLFFSVFHFINLKSAYSKCHKPFRCGILGTLEFPLSNMQPECGLFMVNCSSSIPFPEIQLNSGGIWYEVHQKISTNQLLIIDPFLELQLSNRNFISLQNMSLPKSSSSSITLISPNITLFKCLNEPYNEEIQQHFDRYNYENETCPLFTVYYRNPRNGSLTNEIDVPSQCSVIQMPVNLDQDSGDLFRLLTAEFIIEWNVSDNCSKCYNKGGQCTTDEMNIFHCKTEKSRRTLILGAGADLGAALTVISVLFVLIFVGIRKINKTQNQKDFELFLKKNENLGPKRYKYKKLKKITNSFKNNLGKGGYGSVYKGKLKDGRLVAVKILNESKGNGEEFLNEVASISRTSHVNIVSLLGYCFDGSKRALVYEFMLNGSLEKYISNNLEEDQLGFEKLFEIAVGIARGLEYLHRGCNMQILHFDIKPHNILLDKDLNPKIADFGLAKLCPNGSSKVSMLVARGTIGYIAPEVFYRTFGQVSHKSDVYSYGMMVLEMVGKKKKNNESVAERSSEIYFPNYIYKELETNVVNGGLDGILNEDECRYVKRKLAIVGLWCIQTDPRDRPSIDRVIEMLEGKVESLEVPPRPCLSSPIRVAQSFSTSESIYSH